MTCDSRCQRFDELLLVIAAKMIWNVSPKKRSNSSCHWMVSGAGHTISTRSMASRSFSLFDQQAGHDGLARAGIIGEQETQAGLREHLEINSFDLVGQRADAGQAHGKLAVVSVGQPDAGGLNKQAKFLRVGQRRLRSSCVIISAEGVCFFSGNDGFLQRAVSQPNATFVAIGQWPSVLQNHRSIEVPRKLDSHAYRKIGFCRHFP